MGLFDNTFGLVKNFLDARTAEHNIHASNIANAETPNYKATLPSFEVKLSDNEYQFKMDTKKSTAPSIQRGNNVVVEDEVSALVQNSMSYMSGLKFLSKELSIAKYAISAGK